MANRLERLKTSLAPAVGAVGLKIGNWRKRWPFYAVIAEELLFTKLFGFGGSLLGLAFRGWHWLAQMPLGWVGAFLGALVVTEAAALIWHAYWDTRPQAIARLAPPPAVQLPEPNLLPPLTSREVLVVQEIRKAWEEGSNASSMATRLFHTMYERLKNTLYWASLLIQRKEAVQTGAARVDLALAEAEKPDAHYDAFAGLAANLARFYTDYIGLVYWIHALDQRELSLSEADDQPHSYLKTDYRTWRLANRDFLAVYDSLKKWPELSGSLGGIGMNSPEGKAFLVNHGHGVAPTTDNA